VGARSIGTTSSIHGNGKISRGMQSNRKQDEMTGI